MCRTRFGKPIPFCLALTVQVLFGLGPSDAEPVYGVNFSTGNWTVANHTEESYQALRSYYASQTPKGKFSDGDFYSSIQIVPQFDPSEGNCDSDSNWILKFLKGTVGTSDTSLLLATLTASYSLGHLGQTTFMTEVPLFTFGRGIDPVTNLAASDGCFFNFISRQELPYLRHDGSALQDYNLLFKVRAADTKSSNLVATIKDAAVAAAAAMSWTDLSGVRVTALQTSLGDLEKGMTRAFGQNNAKSVSKKLLTNVGADDGENLVWRLSFNDDAGAHGNMAIYVRLSSSMILDNHRNSDRISIDDVISDRDIGTTRCIPELPAPKCTLSPATFRDALKAYNKDIPIRFYDLSPAGQKKIYDTCLDIRTFAIGSLRLSTIDALFIRWAAARLSGLDAMLADPIQAKSIADASGPGVTADMIKDVCWSAADEGKLKAVASKMPKGKILVDH
jgi:hypothetical protein